VEVAGMRFLPVSKLDQIFRSYRSGGRGRTGCNDVAGMVKRVLSTQCRKGLPDGHERDSVVSFIRAGFSQTGTWRFFTVPRWRSLGTIAGAAAPRLTGACPVQVVRQEGTLSLFQVWKAWRLKEFDSHLQEIREFSRRKFHDGLYWRPAVFVSLADNKSKVYSSTTFSVDCYSGHPVQVLVLRITLILPI